MKGTRRIPNQKESSSNPVWSSASDLSRRVEICTILVNGQLWSVQTAYFQLLLLPCFKSRSQLVKVLNSSIFSLPVPDFCWLQYNTPLPQRQFHFQSQITQGRVRGSRATVTSSAATQHAAVTFPIPRSDNTQDSAHSKTDRPFRPSAPN
ncbi:MAG: hypothetical protein CL912_15400 [Deltaproteobacteria bacterium]|nr:hypothetical protein [Deltaproteobacteria bacterium]